MTKETKMPVCALDNGKTFDCFQWQGDEAVLPRWAKNLEVEENQHHGRLLLVGVYRVRPGRWVLRSHERNDVFPVPEDMFDNIYTIQEGDNA